MPRTAAAADAQPELLDLVLASLDDAVGVLRAPDFHYELANPACQLISLGRPLVGRTFAELFPGLAGAVVPLLRQVAETGRPFHADDMRLDLARLPGGPAEERYFSFTYQRLPPDAAGWPAVLATVRETTAQVLTQRAVEASLTVERLARARLDRFRRLTAAMAAARTAEDVANAALDQGLSAFGADAGWLVVPEDPGTLVTIGSTGYDPVQAAPWRRFPAAAQVPIAEAFRSGQPVHLEDRRALQARYPALAAAGSGWIGLVALPLLVEGKAIGALGLSFHAARQLDASERADFEWLAQKCAQALDRALLHDAERRTHRWLIRLQAATAAASAAATPAAVAGEVARAGLWAVEAASVVVFALEPGGVLRAAASHGLSQAELARLDPMPPGAALPAADAVRTRQAVLLESREALQARYPAVQAVVAGEAAVAALPMVARGEVVGVLRFGFAAAHRFGPAERTFLEALASEAALALERSRGYEAEQRARAEATRVGALQEQLMAVVGHDLRTPLTAVTMSAAMLLRRGDLAPAQHPAVVRIAQGSARMASIIRDLLDFSRLRQGLGMVLRLEPTDLGGLARAAVQELQAAGATVAFEVAVTGDAALLADPARLAQVLANLLGNAVQHGHGTPVRVAVTGRDGEVMVSVQNGGPAIPAEILPHVFEPFRRGGRDVDGERTGSVGLGLHIASEIVRAHGGAIEARSTGAEGTCFAARLPRAPPPGDAAT